VRLIVVSVGRARPPFADDVEHYARLLGRHARLEQIEVGEEQQATILRRVPAEAHLCALDREGEALTSEGLAELIAERRMSRTDVAFVLGGPFGLDPAVLERADRRLSFGPITLPHQLARVVLLEQLFRAHKILAGEPYHY
jgi:23S rRNA (pseudouridine1915-N3)-methyltransferase